MDRAALSWSGVAVSSSWDGTAEAYDRSFARLCAGTVDSVLGSLRPAPAGIRLLDVGCGSGTVAAAARRSGHTVVGLDADASMLGLARRKHPELALVRGALPRLPLASALVDAVTANFVVNHTPDPQASVRELARVVRRGGRVVLTIWPGTVSPMNQLFEDVLAAAEVTPPPRRTLPTDKDFHRTPTGLRDLVAESGLVDVVVREVRWPFEIAPADLWVAVEGGVATIGQTYRAQPHALQERMRHAYRELARARYPDGRLSLPSVALLATATRPGQRQI